MTLRAPGKTPNRDFIRNLELAPPRHPYRSKLEQPKEDQKSGHVDAGSGISFVADVTGQARSDVLNSTLLAQLAANKKYDREKDPRAWYTFYREVLDNVGWDASAWSFNEYQSKSSSFKADTVIFEVLISLLAEDPKLAADATVKALKALSKDDDRATLWESESHRAREGNFQIAAVTQVNQAVSMTIGGFFFSVEKEVDRVLWFEFQRGQVDFWKGTQTATLNEDVYSTVRKDVLDKLGDKATKFVRDLEI
ncbi:hypothetical protein ADK70_26985 [Streptomyces rimosus subsp. pseudoverticillatus]|uniref:hypothetical protein n=1 Tax=Streptomyces rimosus TaxID=1927 RepID=UPI0006B26B6B|nr:hypothetical protein [Streptomyces rimosus]KOT80904.1 hypothetical protein ADK70_26985 [Streptomyces rimosus subsp. pseudoverticillatus]